MIGWLLIEGIFTASDDSDTEVVLQMLSHVIIQFHVVKITCFPSCHLYKTFIMKHFLHTFPAGFTHSLEINQSSQSIVINCVQQSIRRSVCLTVEITLLIINEYFQKLSGIRPLC